jgi:hypothetical protein
MKFEGFNPNKENETKKKGVRDLGIIAAGALAMAAPGPTEKVLYAYETVEAVRGNAMQEAMRNHIPGVTIEDGKLVLSPERMSGHFSIDEIGALEEMLDALNPNKNEGINHERSGNNPDYPVRIEFMTSEEKEKAALLSLLSEATREEVRAAEAKLGKVGGSGVDSEVSIYLSERASAELAAAEAAAELEGVDVLEHLRDEEMSAKIIMDNARNNPVGSALHNERDIKEFEAEQAKASNVEEAEPNRVSAALRAAKS